MKETKSSVMCMSQVSLICLFLLFSSCYVSVLANELDHKYEDGDDVVSWISRVGPLDNLQEIHSYFSLPFCKGSRITDPHQQTFNEILHGIKLESTGYEMKFKTDVSRTIYCMVELREDVVEAFTNAVKKNYGFQMFIDGLSMWGMVGLTDFDTGKYHLYTHSKFEIGYNGKQIVDINLTMGMSTELKAGARIMFSYEVQWKPSNVEFKNRSDLIQYKINWINITYSFVIVIFLFGLIFVMLMQRARKNSKQYIKEEEVLKALSVGNPS